MSGQQLHRITAMVFDTDMIGPEPARLFGHGLILQKIGRHMHGYAIGGGMMGKQGIKGNGHENRNNRIWASVERGMKSIWQRCLMAISAAGPQR
jgi:hypothetical protein